MKRLLAGLAAVAAVAIAPGAARAQDGATVTLLHGIPGATVDVVVDGNVLLPGFEPGATQDLSPFAGQTLENVEVRAAGTEDVVIGPVAEFAVPGSGNWTVIAHLDADGNPTITPFENNTDPTPSGEGRLTVRHTAAAPAVDLVVGDTRPIEGAANGDSAELVLPAGEIAGAQLAPAGGDPIVDVPTVNLASGDNLIVYAVGSLEGETFTFYTQNIVVGNEEPEGPVDGEGDDAAADEEEGDGTPVPVSVETGTPITDGTNLALLAAAGAMVVLAGGALTLRRRSVER
jgi:hypothetical protein